ncbi:MAG: DUF3617 family protein [Oceanospirillales bacterium]|nr:MAG: DUF3617 family protein [Oceanospirillales bacterium]
MRFYALLSAVLTGAVIFSSSAQAETPNINPGFWQHNTSLSLQGPFNMPPQVTTDQECITQADIDKGVDVLDLPKECSLTTYDIRRDGADYSMQCDIQGMKADFKGRLNFNGDNMNGSMSSDVETPLGVMTMQMQTEARRIRDC